MGKGTFDPWVSGSASRGKDGTITGTISLKADSGLKVVSAEVHGDGQFLTCVFAKMEMES